MNIYEAIESDRIGHAEGWTLDGRVRAYCFGANSSIKSKRKRKKAMKNLTITLWDPPLRPESLPSPPMSNDKTRVTRTKMSDLSQSLRQEILSLHWLPKTPRNAIDRLADLA